MGAKHHPQNQPMLELINNRLLVPFEYELGVFMTDRNDNHV